MKKLLSTTALALVLGLPAMALADTAAPAASQTGTQQSATMSGFLAVRGQSDVFATDLMGHDVYARRSPDAMSGSDDKADARSDEKREKADAKSDEMRGKAQMNAGGKHGMSTMNRADLDDMDNIGQINEIVLSDDGQIRALVIGVGGFLGMGERDVAVTMDQVTFASDADDRSEMYVIVNAGKEMLKESPAYDRTAMTTDDAEGDARARDDDRAREGDQARDERSAFEAPEITREGYNRVEANEVSTEILMGKSVYDGSDTDVGTVTDMIVDDKGLVTDVIIDFGGFLGLGQSQVSMGFEELTIMTTEGYEDVRVYVAATKEQVQNRPRYQASK